ncbi:hypothetical protein MMC26_002135 [Xylographa opegraphella]|nr:hypothetical protein [Xylographa opegraphella]
MDAHHRKIDLQAPQDLTYLLGNITKAAQEKLDIHFPPSAAPQGEEDALRTKVEGLVHQVRFLFLTSSQKLVALFYITSTFTLALPSLSINGIDASPAHLAPLTTAASAADDDDATANYEDYDPALAAKVRALYATLEEETTRVAELRREAPAQAAGAFVERLGREMADEELRAEAGRTWAMEEGAKVVLEAVVDSRVGEGWERGLRGLQGLTSVTEGVARLERVRGVVGEVESGR